MHAFGEIPIVDFVGVGVGDGLHFGVEGGLAEAFFVDAGGVEEFVGDDGVEHSHAAFVEDAEDGFVFFEVAGEFLAERRWRREQCLGAGTLREGMTCFRSCLTADGPLSSHALEAVEEFFVGEIVGPEGGVW